MALAPVINSWVITYILNKEILFQHISSIYPKTKETVELSNRLYKVTTITYNIRHSNIIIELKEKKNEQSKENNNKKS